MQGVVLATDVLGSTVMISSQGQEGTGTGTQATSTPEAGATATGGTGTGVATATGTTGTTGLEENTQGTVEDIIIEPEDGNLKYLVIRTGTEDRWIPIPIGFLQWDATTNGFVLMISGNALQNAPAFSSDQFPDTTAEGWDQEWSDFWASNGGMGTGTGSGTGGVTVSTATATP
jgi:hypothetical protein